MCSGLLCLKCNLALITHCMTNISGNISSDIILFLFDVSLENNFVLFDKDTK